MYHPILSSFYKLDELSRLAPFSTLDFLRNKSHSCSSTCLGFPSLYLRTIVHHLHDNIWKLTAHTSVANVSVMCSICLWFSLAIMLRHSLSLVLRILWVSITVSSTELVSCHIHTAIHDRLKISSKGLPESNIIA